MPNMEGNPVQIDEQTFSRMPTKLQALFAKAPNHSKDEVVGAFPNTASGSWNGKRNTSKTKDVFGTYASHDEAPRVGDSGSAARFFYSAKASKADRAGSKHPTVKPIALMEWLATLITPPGGTILDPFAGSGTTGAAAVRKGFNVVLCEREDEYVRDIRARFGVVNVHPWVRVLAWNAAVTAYRAVAHV